MSSAITQQEVFKDCSTWPRLGMLEPDLRINYTFGLVLGEDEFRQEQHYFLEHNFLHNRALHGYGTVSGLQVCLKKVTRGSAATTTVTTDCDKAIEGKVTTDGEDIEITISTGMGVDQDGRMFVVDKEMCCRLVEWLNKEAKLDPPSLGSPDPTDGIIQGDLTVYIVAAYDEVFEKTVPILGQPCSTNAEDNRVQSRIRDSVQPRLTWKKPDMRQWYVRQDFIRVLSKIRPTTDENEDQTDELIDFLKGRASGVPLSMRVVSADKIYAEPSGTALEGVSLTLEQVVKADARTAANDWLHIQLDDGRAGWIKASSVEPSDDIETLHLGEESVYHITAKHSGEIFSRWVTEVGSALQSSPYHLPDAFGNEAENDILLGTLTFKRDANSISNVKLDDTTRPIMFDTQFLQQTLLNKLLENKTQRPFASLRVESSKTLKLWVNYPLDITLPLAALDLKCNGAAFTIARLDDRGKGVFTIHTDDAVAAQDRLELTLNLDLIMANGQSIFDHLSSLDYDFIGRVGKYVTVEAVAENSLEVRDFVTMGLIAPETKKDTYKLRLWFHTPQALNLTNSVTLERNGITAGDFEVTAVDPASPKFSLVWDLKPKPPTPKAKIHVFEEAERLVITFDLAKVLIGDKGDNKALSEWLQSQPFTLLDYDDEVQMISAFHIINLPPEVITAQTVDAQIAQAITTLHTEVEAERKQAEADLRTLPFVTITPISRTPDGEVTYELWFHLDTDARIMTDITLTKVNLSIYAEQPTGAPVFIPITDPQPFENWTNVYLVTTDMTSLDDPKPDLKFVRFIFPLTGNNSIGDPDLQTYMTSKGIKFEGYKMDWKENNAAESLPSIVAYVRLPSNLEQA